MYLIVEYVLDERVQLLLRVPRPNDYTKKLYYVDEEDLQQCLTNIAKKHELDITNEEHLEEFDTIVTIIPYKEIKLPSDLLK